MLSYFTILFVISTEAKRNGEIFFIMISLKEDFSTSLELTVVNVFLSLFQQMDCNSFHLSV